jgi:hypothetical protein
MGTGPHSRGRLPIARPDSTHIDTGNLHQFLNGKREAM